MKKFLFFLTLFYIVTYPAQQRYGSITSYTTAKDATQTFVKSDTTHIFKMDQPKENQIAVFINPEKKYQEVLGFGGAVTDATAETFAKMPSDKQKEFLQSYYGKEGLSYNVVRTTMNSSDFSSDSYTYVQDGDKDLKTFNIAHDLKYKVPLIKDIQKESGKNMILYFSPWSAPAWMKTNDDMLHGGSLLPQYRQAWANYYVKFIKAYEKLGLPFWGLTIQNEPMAVQTWESMIYTAQQERDFLKDYLGPTLWRAGMKNKKIIIWDHNRDLIYQRASVTLSDPQAAKYVWGVGFHWYETWSGTQPLFDNVAETRRAFPQYHYVFTEGTKEKFNFNQVHDWSIGELYGRNMIHDFNNGISMWTDWNLMVDQTGGPNHVGNFCFAPIIGDTQTKELIYMPSYYYIGHLSKFVKKGARRLGTTTNRSWLLATSFVNPNGDLVAVVMNEDSQPLDYYLWIDGKAAKAKAPAHSITTFVLSK